MSATTSAKVSLHAYFNDCVRFKDAIIEGCHFSECTIEVDGTAEFWYCCFSNASMNLEEFEKAWSSIWEDDLPGLARFLYELSRKGSQGLWITGVLTDLVGPKPEDLAIVKRWDPLFTTCVGKLNGIYLDELLRHISKKVIGAVVDSERANLERLAEGDDEDYDYDDDC